MTPTSSCASLACRTVTPGEVERCPACGGKTVSSRRIARMGWVQLACGLFLVGLMGWITAAMYPTLSRAGEAAADGSRFNGTPEQAGFVLTLFGTVIAFGLVAIAGGLWQIRTGRRSLLVMGAMVVAVLLLLFMLLDMRSVFPR